MLYRTNSQSRAIEEALVRANIPYRIFGGVKFYERKEIKDILSYMRLVANPHDRASLMRVVNVPARKLGAKSVETIAEYLDNYGLDCVALADMLDSVDGLAGAAREGYRQFGAVLARARERMESASVADVMKSLIEDLGYIAYLEANHTPEEVTAKRDNLDEFLSLASRYEGLDPLEGYRTFLEEIALITDQDRDSEGERVSLLTIHLAKGLEFERVVIAGAEEGLFPHSRTLTEPKDMEEERRLMYVAMTRAKRELHITRARERFTFGNYSSNPSSRFLDEIPAEHVDMESK
ncbi:MAG TPA: 3'-5' exonuclease [bacterium]|nr:3'-5' exonuclease [bacterium]